MSESFKQPTAVSCAHNSWGTFCSVTRCDQMRLLAISV